MKNFSILVLVMVSLFSIATLNSLTAQDEFKVPEEDLSTHFFSASFQVGNLIPHYDFMAAYQEKTVKSGTLCLEKRLKGGWADSFNGLGRGIEIHHTGLGSPDMLGNASHVIFYSRLNLHSKSKSKFFKDFKGTLKLGGGIGLLTQKFDLESNPGNLAIGSYANVAFTVEYEFITPLPFRDLYIGSVVKFTHYSNGAYRKPNLGLNLLTAGIVLKRRKQNLSIRAFERERSAKQHQFNVLMSAGINEFNVLTNSYSNYSIGLNYIKNIGKYNVGLFSDIQFSNAFANEVSLALNKNEVWRSSAGAIGGFQFGRSALQLELGIYLKNDIDILTPYYERLYFSHDITDGLAVRIGIKAHGTVAETLELGLIKFLKSW